MRPLLAAGLALAAFPVGAAHAHDPAPAGSGEATYLANEAVMVTLGGHKILFDPLFVSGFDTYAEVPPDMRADIIAGTGDFAGVDAVFFSHVHADHFDAGAVIEMLKAEEAGVVILPADGAAALRAEPGWEERLEQRLIVLDPDGPVRGDGTMLQGASEFVYDIDYFSVPHAGWPEQNTEIEHWVFRIGMRGHETDLEPENPASRLTVAHFGDATPEPAAYVDLAPRWIGEETHTAFVPFWAYGDLPAWRQVEEALGIEQSIGIHVPIAVPDWLDPDRTDFFTTPGESRILHLNQER